MRNNSFLHVFFDLDNTLTPSRSPMAAAHRPLFRELCERKNVVIVSGATSAQIQAQIPQHIGAQFFKLSQTGNFALDKDGTVIWQEEFTPEQTQAVYDLIEKIKAELTLTVKDTNDLVENRGSQISYSPIGHNEDLDKKRAFDPKTDMRRRIITEHADEVERLNALGVDVVPGGTTCFDFFLAGKNKGFNVARLCERESWNKDECMYVGDALFPGGNDETVIGVVPTKAVQDPDETFEWIEKILQP